MLSEEKIDQLLAEDARLSRYLAWPATSFVVPEFAPRAGTSLVTWLYVARKNVLPDVIQDVVSAAVSVLDSRSIWKSFSRIGVTIAVAENAPNSDKVCYLEAARGRISTLRDVDIYSAEVTDKTKGTFIIWPTNSTVTSLLQRKPR